MLNQSRGGQTFWTVGQFQKFGRRRGSHHIIWFFHWIVEKKIWNNLSKILLKTTQLYSTKAHCVLTCFENKWTIPDVRARTRAIIKFDKRWDEKPHRTVLASVLDSMVPLSLSAVNSHTFGCAVAHYSSYILACFTSRIRRDALHVDVNDVLPPNGAQIERLAEQYFGHLNSSMKTVSNGYGLEWVSKRRCKRHGGGGGGLWDTATTVAVQNADGLINRFLYLSGPSSNSRRAHTARAHKMVFNSRSFCVFLFSLSVKRKDKHDTAFSGLWEWIGRGD